MEPCTENKLLGGETNFRGVFRILVVGGLNSDSGDAFLCRLHQLFCSLLGLRRGLAEAPGLRVSVVLLWLPEPELSF